MKQQLLSLLKKIYPAKYIITENALPYDTNIKSNIHVTISITNMKFITLLHYFNNDMKMLNGLLFLDIPNNKFSFDIFISLLLLTTTQTSLTKIIGNDIVISKKYLNIITEETPILNIFKILNKLQLQNNISFGLSYVFLNEDYMTIQISNDSNKVIDYYKNNEKNNVTKLNAINKLRKSYYYQSKQNIIHNQLSFISDNTYSEFQLIFD